MADEIDVVEFFARLRKARQEVQYYQNATRKAQAEYDRLEAHAYALVVEHGTMVDEFHNIYCLHAPSDERIRIIPAKYIRDVATERKALQARSLPPEPEPDGDHVLPKQEAVDNFNPC